MLGPSPVIPLIPSTNASTLNNLDTSDQIKSISYKRVYADAISTMNFSVEDTQGNKRLAVDVNGDTTIYGTLESDLLQINQRLSTQDLTATNLVRLPDNTKIGDGFALTTTNLNLTPQNIPLDLQVGTTIGGLAPLTNLPANVLTNTAVLTSTQLPMDLQAGTTIGGQAPITSIPQNLLTADSVLSNKQLPIDLLANTTIGGSAPLLATSSILNTQLPSSVSVAILNATGSTPSTIAGSLTLNNSSLNNKNQILFNNGRTPYIIQQMDSGGVNSIRLSRQNYADLEIDSTGKCTIANTTAIGGNTSIYANLNVYGSTTLSSSTTIGGATPLTSIPTNVLTTSSTLSKTQLPTDLNSNTTIGGVAPLTTIPANVLTTNSTLTKSQLPLDLASNTTIGGQAVVSQSSDGFVHIPNHLSLFSNGTYSVFFLESGSSNVWGRLFAVAGTGMYFDFANQFTFRCTSLPDDQSGMDYSYFIMSRSGISTSKPFVSPSLQTTNFSASGTVTLPSTTTVGGSTPLTSIPGNVLTTSSSIPNTQLPIDLKSGTTIGGLIPLTSIPANVLTTSSSIPNTQLPTDLKSGTTIGGLIPMTSFTPRADTGWITVTYNSLQTWTHNLNWYSSATFASPPTPVFPILKGYITLNDASMTNAFFDLSSCVGFGYSHTGPNTIIWYVNSLTVYCGTISTGATKSTASPAKIRLMLY